MAQILVRNLSLKIIERLKLRAKRHHRSLQGEAKLILEEATKMSMEEALAVAKGWHKRMAGRKFTDNAELIREDRNR